MEGERAGPVLRERRAGNVTKQTSPTRTKKTVSVAAIFKQKPQKTSRFTPQPIVTVSRLSVERASDGKARSLKSRSSSRSPRKSVNKVSKKKSEAHPLAVAFKETSDDYRRHLYQTTTSKINKTLELLLHTLYESNLRTISSDGNSQEPRHSPIRLTIPAKLAREAAKIYTPISEYQIRLTRTNTNGEREKLASTLETRMLDYEDHIAETSAEVDRLRQDWETIVGEIWKLGVAVLGEEKMEALLKVDCPHFSESMGLQGSTLVVPEHGISPPPRKASNKKRVTFEDPNGLPKDQNSLAFLYSPSVLKPVPIVHALPEQDIKDLEKSVDDLGVVHVNDLRKLEKESREYWSKKKGLMMKLLEVDE